MNPLATRVLVGLSLWLQTGCASILNGETQSVEIRSDPPGATALILPEHVEIVTPADAELTRAKVHTLIFELAGHEPETVYLDRLVSNTTILNIVFGGVIGMLVDIQNDTNWRLAPDSVHVKLEPLAGRPLEKD